ncbi:MAG: hypothetical protein ACI8QG_000563, partial [Flavobacteriales bacterium]
NFYRLRSLTTHYWFAIITLVIINDGKLLSKYISMLCFTMLT